MCCHRKFWRGGLPRSKLLERRLGVLTDRHLAYIADGNRTVPRELGKIKVRSDRGTVEFGILWCDQHKLVAQQIDPRVVLMSFLLEPKSIHSGLREANASPAAPCAICFISAELAA